MFKHAIVALAVVLVAGVGSAFAQTSSQAAHPRFDVFGGLSFLPSDELDDFPRADSTGFQITATWHANRWFGVFFDLGGHYSTNADLGPGFPGQVAETSVYEILVGPRFTFGGERAHVFVHALIGSCKGITNIGFSDSGGTFGGGGGVDVDLTRRLAVRGQFDYFGSFADIVDVNTRFAVGLVLKLGTQ